MTIHSLNLKYIVRKLRYVLWCKRHPDAPWMSPQAVAWLDAFLRPSDIGLEFGSGRSTVWFARRAAALTSVEHKQDWHKSVSARIRELKLTHVIPFLTTNR